jgi:hypothetical protein
MMFYIISVQQWQMTLHLCGIQKYHKLGDIKKSYIMENPHYGGSLCNIIDYLILASVLASADISISSDIL